jgi:saccharopine dehydrogenase-like NADP-dependent oxidoreductase
MDLSESRTLVNQIGSHDLTVCALPSRLGFAVQRAAIVARRNLIDVSFAAEDPMVLDSEARDAGVTIVPDCGAAPGLSNLMVGRALATLGTPDEITIMVGGGAEDRSLPYGYVVTWSLDDLMEEYTRPARIRRDGRVTLAPVFSGLEAVEVDGVGTLEAFYSDGLRSLLANVPGVRDMGEKTLRWPGHATAVQPLIASGRLVDELRARCTIDPPRDFLALIVRCRWGDDTRQVTMVDRYDPDSGLTAMARTTALTAAAVTRFAAQWSLGGHGVKPLELLGQDERVYRFVVDAMEGHGVWFDGAF